MGRKYRKNDKDVRSALWQAYERRDVYTGELLKYREMEIDHIVPESAFRGGCEKNEQLIALGLDSDFEKDSLENYVPTRRKPNLDKGKSIDPIVIKSALNKAKNMKPQVEELIRKYNEESNFITEVTRVAILADSEEKKQEAADIIWGEEEEFENREYITDDQFVKSINRVKINAYLPTLEKYSPSCAFMFRPIKLRECIVVVNHTEIFNSLFIANGEYEELSERPFILGKKKDGSYNIHLGGCSFYLSESETWELCEIIDKYNKVYFEKVNEIEEAYALGGMTINQHAEIKLCVLKKEFCKIIFWFVNRDKKVAEWDIFEKNNVQIKVYTDENNKKYNMGYHAIIDAKPEMEGTDWHGSSMVGLYLKTYYTNPRSKLSDRNWWNPMQVRAWLFDEFFPVCLKEYYRYNRIKNIHKINFRQECRKHCIEQRDKRIKVANKTDMIELYDTICILQNFYAISINRQVHFEGGSNDFYNSLRLLIKGCTEDLYYPYINSKLGIEEYTREALYDYLRRKNNLYKLSYLQVEMTLRCFIECISKGKTELSQKEYIEFWKGMNDIVNEYNYHMVRERLL